MSVTSGTKRKEGGIGETARVVFHALIIALVIRTFLFQPFNIPSGSMKATLLVGDYLFVSKYSYGYSKYSLPLSPPVFSGRLPGGMTPDRGDVVVFRLPKDPSVDYIKRVIGLPGDKIQVIDGQVFINGTAVKRERAPDFVETEEGTREAPVKRWKETLPNGNLLHARPRRQRLRRQHPGLYRAARRIFHDGRQPRQLDRQPLQPGRLRAAAEHCRQGAAYLLLRL